MNLPDSDTQRRWAINVGVVVVAALAAAAGWFAHASCGCSLDPLAEPPYVETATDAG